MKKSVLALSITAAVAGLGFAGGAQAMVTVGGATALSDLYLNGDGVGHILMVPYFTAQADNSTLINLVNTDTINGKAVKVRFRGAGNSDDIFDFQVFMSPGDVWSASISKGADGRAKFTTTDATCSKPSASVLNSTSFVTARLDPTLTTDGKANATREGYVEIFNMADIPKRDIATPENPHPYQPVGTNQAGPDADVDGVNDLYQAIKHVASVAPCSGAAWSALDTTNLANPAAAKAAGLLPPSTGLVGNWTIINVVSAAAWSGAAVAVQSALAAVPPFAPQPVLGNVVYWPQTADPVGATIDTYTADPLLRSTGVYRNNGAYVADATPGVVAAYYDLPDLSTSYTAFGAGNTFVQAANITNAIAATSATNEFLTNTAINASTDWVFSMPTRRYSTALDYAAIAAGDDGRRFSDLFGPLGVNTIAAGTFTQAYFNAANTLVTSRIICVKGITVKVYDREENTLTGSTDVVVSPSTPADPLSFCGEDAVLSVNNGGIQASGTGALKAAVAVKDLDVTYRDGWMRLATPAATALPAGWTAGLPVLGASFARAWAGPQSFGASWPHRFSR